jgi:hypothetical protein
MSELGEHTNGIEPGASGDGRVLVGGSLAAVFASVSASLLTYGSLPSELPVGTGPETAPTALVLTIFPVLVAAVAFGGHWLATRLRAVDEFRDIRALHTTAVLGILLVVLGSQASLVLANL